MPTVIDSFVVELGLDPTNLTKGQATAVASFKKTQEAAAKGAKDVEAQGKRLNDFFGGVKREALGLLSAFVGGRGVQEFTQYVTTLDAATGRMAKTLGVTTRELSTFQGLAPLAGGSAEGMAGTLQKLTQGIQNLQITGNASIIPFFRAMGISLTDANRKFKTSTELLVEMAHWAKAQDPVRAAAFFQNMGIDQGTINVLLGGDDALRKLIADQERLGVITQADADAAIKLQNSWRQAEQAATSLGRTIVTELSPSLSVLLDRWTQIFAELRQGQIISPGGLLDRLLKWGGSFLSGSESRIGHRGQRRPTSSAAPAVGGSSGADTVAYIRQAAIARGIDPDVAVQVAQSEGLNSYVGDRGSSFGPFQLHYGGVASGGMAVSGLGDEFTHKTGLNARDPATVRAQIDFALDEAKRKGWGAWHGWRGLPNAGIGALPAGAAAVAGASGSSNSRSSTTTVTVGQVVVNTQATDAQGIARAIKPAIERQTFAAQANYGQQ